MGRQTFVPVRQDQGSFGVTAPGIVELDEAPRVVGRVDSTVGTGKHSNLLRLRRHRNLKGMFERESPSMLNSKTSIAPRLCSCGVVGHRIRRLHDIAIPRNRHEICLRAPVLEIKNKNTSAKTQKNKPFIVAKAPKFRQIIRTRTLCKPVRTS